MAPAQNANVWQDLRPPANTRLCRVWQIIAVPTFGWVADLVSMKHHRHCCGAAGQAPGPSIDWHHDSCVMGSDPITRHADACVQQRCGANAERTQYRGGQA
jgi:hypothetical protein